MISPPLWLRPMRVGSRGSGWRRRNASTKTPWVAPVGNDQMCSRSRPPGTRNDRRQSPHKESSASPPHRLHIARAISRPHSLRLSIPMHLACRARTDRSGKYLRHLGAGLTGPSRCICRRSNVKCRNNLTTQSAATRRPGGFHGLFTQFYFRVHVRTSDEVYVGKRRPDPLDRGRTRNWRIRAMDQMGTVPDSVASSRTMVRRAISGMQISSVGPIE
jgi:hypothetical protein